MATDWTDVLLRAELGCIKTRRETARGSRALSFPIPDKELRALKPHGRFLKDQDDALNDALDAFATDAVLQAATEAAQAALPSTDDAEFDEQKVRGAVFDKALEGIRALEDLPDRLAAAATRLTGAARRKSSVAGSSGTSNDAALKAMDDQSWEIIEKGTKTEEGVKSTVRTMPTMVAEAVTEAVIHEWARQMLSRFEDQAAKTKPDETPKGIGGVVTRGVTWLKRLVGTAAVGFPEWIRTAAAAKPDGRPRAWGLVGLALSGGGIRSAAVNLGALQALNERGLFNYVDYLSTVSGGGYIGCCLSSLYAKGMKTFPFERQRGEPESKLLKHLRDHSSYLAVRGLVDWMRLPLMFVRGLVLNFLIVLPVLLAAAAATIWLKPTKESLGGDFLRDHLGDHISWLGEGYIVTKGLLVVLLILIIGYAFARRFDWGSADRKWRGRASKIGGWFVLITATIAIVETLPSIIQLYVALLGGEDGKNVAQLGKQGALVTTIVILGGGMITWAAVRFAHARQAGQMAARIRAVAVGIAGPGILLILYIHLYVRGVIHYGNLLTFFNSVAERPFVIWLANQVLYRDPDVTAVIFVYLAVAVVIWIFVYFGSDVNVSSLHGFYRDRLSEAFMLQTKDDVVEANDEQRLSELDTRNAPYHLINTTVNLPKTKGSKLDVPTGESVADDLSEDDTAPADAEGDSQGTPARRHAGFFLFSREYCGSHRIEYCETRTLEDLEPHLNLATAMAISGAAAASFMGVSTNRAVSFFLALFNLRLGYWLPNPAKLDKIKDRIGFRKWMYRPGARYLFFELIGDIHAGKSFVNLSDGGHIENLGIYELLRRKCRLIIAIDAERDSGMNFGGLARLIMMARIDMGIDIKIEPDDLRRIAQGHEQECGSGKRKKGKEREREKKRKEKGGSHHAVGLIDYGDGTTGRLIYIKSSLWGDENVYIRSYKGKHREFPHETTGDQFFTETQFECYRALGYHLVEATFGCEERPSDK